MRYFVELAYKGTNYAGFQVQQNANTVQSEVEKALAIVLRKEVALTGSSRTDSGVHAKQNYFHFDIDIAIKDKTIYNVNAVLPHDIVVKKITQVADDAHCRLLALYRQYTYYITAEKNPFIHDTAWYFPYKVDLDLLNKAASVLFDHEDCTAFSKRNTQVHTYNCKIEKSEWKQEGNNITYHVQSNRFLRGMVRGLVGTMLLVGRKKISVDEFVAVIESKDCTNVNFATPAHGLFLEQVHYPESTFIF